MKFCIAVCILGLLAYHEASCNRIPLSGQSEPHFPALLRGNCSLDEAGDLQQCVRITCTKRDDGVILMIGETCGITTCPNGQQIGGGPYDLTKKYPECCEFTDCD